MDESTSANVVDEALTPTEEKLLEALMDPVNRFKNQKELADILGCDPKTIQRAWKKPAFVVAQQEIANEVIARHVMPAVHALGKEASRGSHAHILTTLDMAGVYSPKQRIESTGPGGGPVEIVIVPAKVEE